MNNLTLSFQNYIRKWYLSHGRHELPWRQTTDPYKILLSELMLQQTQVERVIPKFLAFLDRFPDTKSLSDASLRDVLVLWQGLGYNRRAKYLYSCAQTIESNYQGHFPQTESELLQLPGIGPYTASAVCAFAYNQPVTLIETNVRTVYLHHFFPEGETIPDSELLSLIKATVDLSQPREWYWALMDYGSYLKKILPNPNRRSKQYTKQSVFKGSLRQVRGEIIRALTKYELLERGELQASIQGDKLHFPKALEQLLEEKLVVFEDDKYSLGTTL